MQVKGIDGELHCVFVETVKERDELGNVLSSSLHEASEDEVIEHMHIEEIDHIDDEVRLIYDIIADPMTGYKHRYCADCDKHLDMV